MAIRSEAEIIFFPKLLYWIYLMSWKQKLEKVHLIGNLDKFKSLPPYAVVPDCF